ncbi:hypothetical protein AMECASPLE_016233 [Ameca splendens]|uniref:Uncharacterized protein n=1 Tax=Ameca splendens TaxID=208324 RepID=A0ABV0ZDA4_9TELE
MPECFASSWLPKSRSKLRDLSGDPSNRSWTLDLLFPRWLLDWTIPHSFRRTLSTLLRSSQDCPSSGGSA